MPRQRNCVAAWPWDASQRRSWHPRRVRYVLDPADVYGPDYPFETFRVLRDNEIRRYGEYRTQRLVLEAWDNLDDQTW